jgi:hypothetical protein
VRGSPYLVGGTERLEVELGQGLNDIAATLNEIFPYERSKSEELFVRVAVLVNDLHLLDYCRLSGLAGACCRESVSACMKKAMLGVKQDQVGRDGRYLCMCRTKMACSVFGASSAPDGYVESRDMRIRMTATRSVDIRHGMGGTFPQTTMSLSPFEGQRIGVGHVPSNKILHSRLYLFESSSI